MMRNRIMRCSLAFAKNLKVIMAAVFATMGVFGIIIGLGMLGNWIVGPVGIAVGIMTGVGIGIAAVITYAHGDCDMED